MDILTIQSGGHLEIQYIFLHEVMGGSFGNEVGPAYMLQQKLHGMLVLYNRPQNVCKKMNQCTESWLTINFASLKFKFTPPWIKALTDKVMKLAGALL